MNVSELRKKVAQFNNKPGVGFNPRTIVLSFEDFEALREELRSLIVNTYVGSDDSIAFMGIKVVHDSQVLNLTKEK